MGEAEDLLRQSLDIRRTVCPDDKANIATSELLSGLNVTRDLISIPIEKLQVWFHVRYRLNQYFLDCDLTICLRAWCI